MDGKKIGIIVMCLCLASLFTLIIVRQSNARYTSLAAKVTAYEPKVFIPVRGTVSADQVTAVQVPASMAAGLVRNAGDLAGKTTVCALEPGDLIYKNELGTSPHLASGCVSLLIRVDEATSDLACSGDRVDIYSVTGGAPAVLLAPNILVLAGYDSGGNVLAPADRQSSGGPLRSLTGGKVPSGVELMVPRALVPVLLGAAKAGSIYLVRL